MPGIRQTRVRSVDIATHAHATEDLRRVEQAVLNLLPPEVRGKAKPRASKLEGHHGNPITRLELSLSGEDAELTVRWIGEHLGESDKLLLESSFDARYDERHGKLFLRFSKQDAYLGRVRLMDGDDVVRVVIGFRGSPSVEKARRIARELGLLP